MRSGEGLLVDGEGELRVVCVDARRACVDALLVPFLADGKVRMGVGREDGAEFDVVAVANSEEGGRLGVAGRGVGCAASAGSQRPEERYV